MKWKNFCARCIVKLFRPSKKQKNCHQCPKRFLIVSTTGVGDTIWATPAIRALGKSHPDAEIFLITSKIGAQVLDQNPYIDFTFVLGRCVFYSLSILLFKLRKKQFDSVLVFHASQRILIPFSALLCASKIIGTKGENKGLDCLFTKTLKKLNQHEIDRRLDIVREVGAHPTDFHLEIIVKQSDEDKVAHFLHNHKVPHHIPLIGIHPGSRNLFKQWPKDHFIEVAKRLVQHLGCQIFVSGDTSESHFVKKIASEITGAIPLAGTFELSTLAALLRKLNLMISNDTGPMHLAFAAKTPTVALFGPTDPSICGPYFPKRTIKILKTTTVCNPCLAKKCTAPFCLLQLGPEAVFNACISAYRALAPY